MRAYPQPLSEEFVYSSPEKPTRGSYRWVAVQTLLKRSIRLTLKEVRDEPKRRR